MFGVSAKVLDTRGTGDGVTSTSCFLTDGSPMVRVIANGYLVMSANKDVTFRTSDSENG